MHPPFGSDEAQTVLGVDADHLDAVGVFPGDLIVEERLEVSLGGQDALALDRDGTAAIHPQAPLSDIAVMGAPIGQRTA